MINKYCKIKLLVYKKGGNNNNKGDGCATKD